MGGRGSSSSKAKNGGGGNEIKPNKFGRRQLTAESGDLQLGDHLNFNFKDKNAYWTLYKPDGTKGQRLNCGNYPIVVQNVEKKGNTIKVTALLDNAINFERGSEEYKKRANPDKMTKLTRTFKADEKIFVYDRMGENWSDKFWKYK